MTLPYAFSLVFFSGSPDLRCGAEGLMVENFSRDVKQTLMTKTGASECPPESKTLSCQSTDT